VKKGNKNNKPKIGTGLEHSSKGIYTFLIVVVVAATFISYFPALKNEFTNWDDDLYVTANPYIQKLSWESISGFFSRFQNANYHPLTFVSLAIDYHFAELKPGLYHFTNILFHIFNTLLVFVFVKLLFKKQSIAFVAALLFGVHTLHVESVAWVAERKDVLYMFFFMLSLCAYVMYVQKGKLKFLLYSILCFVLSCFSKGQAVSLAATVIFIDIFLQRKFDLKVILEKVIFVTIALVFGFIAIKAQNSADAIFDNASNSFFDRMLFAAYGFVNYLVKLIYPYKLSAIYPYPEKGKIGIEFWICFFIALAILASWVRSFKKTPVYFFALAFFMANIFWVLQLIPVGNALMADRYAYVPSLGFFIMIGWLYEEKIKKEQSKRMAMFILIAYSGLLSYQTFQRSKVWKNSLTLWEDTVKKHPDAEVAWNNLGSYYNNALDYNSAIASYNEAIKVNPLYADAYSNRGMSKKNTGDYQGAIADLDKAIELKPISSFAYSTKGVALTYLNDLETSYKCFEKALQLDPMSGDAYSGMGVVKTRTGRVKEALKDFKRSLEIRPDHPETISNQGIARAESGDMQGAIADFTTAIQLKPDYSGAYLNRGLTYKKIKQDEQACNDFYKASQLGSPQGQTLVNQYCTKK